MVVSDYIHAPAGLLEDKGPQYPVYGGLERAHNDSRHDVLTVNFLWQYVSFTFPCPHWLCCSGAGGGGRRGHLAQSLITHRSTSDSSGTAIVWRAVHVYRVELLLFYVQLANCVYCR
jgi:hypothetical protein